MASAEDKSTETSAGDPQSLNANGEGINAAARLHAVRDRIARRLARPVLETPPVSLPDIEPLRQSKALADHFAGAVGTVNPRPPGLLNELLQTWKRFISRTLGWTYRPQRDFNRAVVDSMAQTSEILDRMNSNLAALARGFDRARDIHQKTCDDIDSTRDDLNGNLDSAVTGLQQKIDLMAEQFEEKVKKQGWAYDGALARQSTALQDRTYELLGELQEHLWKIVGNVQEETRMLRQRVAAQARAGSSTAAPVASSALPAATSSLTGLDYFQLERHFRGTEEEIRKRQSFYVPVFSGRKNVLDIACGRGEFLDLMREAKVTARGVDLDGDMVGRCREKGLNVVQSDVFSFLDTLPDASLDGIFCSQFVEHLQPEAYIKLIMRCGEKLAPGGVLAVETQNPECLAIFSQTFYLDPTHVRPIPPALLRVLFAEAGLERLNTHYLSPASETLPLIPQFANGPVPQEQLQSWNAAVAKFNETFFGGMDYSIIGYRVSSASAQASDANAG